MIIGNGDIAKVIVDRPDRLFFASGVSNSGEIRESEYRREKDLLLAQDMTKHIVYISSLSIFYSDSRYTQHKKQMEELIKTYFPSHTIIRIGNITWGTNPHTLINYFKNKKARGEPLEIKDAWRYVVDKAEFLHWLSLIPDWSCEMNITGRRLKVEEIVKEYVDTDK